MFAHHFRRTTIAFLTLAAVTVPASAGWLPSPFETAPRLESAETVRMAQSGCSAAAAQAAAQSGGQVLSVQTAQRGGQTVCIVTVLIPAQDGNRPRRQTITIPQ
ncbi:hypothetical protein [Aureimonas sp. AU12]|uniref:hypothetical protein n=1 Tax=Aureimonas sp. AU12 TaxID=1638161 RepID=UPI000783CDDC|nr:hypothetical protein [Aureimonas sp. AU12]